MPLPAISSSADCCTTAITTPLTTDTPVAITITEPTVALNGALTHLLGTASVLTSDELTYLDFVGNKNGVYDIGDFLAWVNKTGAVPATAPVEEGR